VEVPGTWERKGRKGATWVRRHKVKKGTQEVSKVQQRGGKLTGVGENKRKKTKKTVKTPSTKWFGWFPLKKEEAFVKWVKVCVGV